MCPHRPFCPGASAPDHLAAHAVGRRPEQGRSRRHAWALVSSTSSVKRGPTVGSGRFGSGRVRL
ncbi:DUF5999 family protein [Streptomyces sp. SID3343]|uniref:DUF5999 family protein n=1 Tax=Streptomyces sp. SID3343 TaxID=2690260 RepID=UPI001F283950|nr:DUF5999 family protein [Streptomyces sp. SID3343]